MPLSIDELIRTRRSYRRYTSESVPVHLFSELIEALRWAPSSGNLQARRFFFITNPDLKQRLVDACFDHAWMAQAPLLIVGCTDAAIRETYGDAGVTTYAIMDISASVQNLLLAAQARGLGACWVCAFAPDRVRQIMELPGELNPVLMITVGWPDEEPPLPDRLPPEQVVSFID